MSDNDSALTVIEDRLPQYGSRESIRELGNRIKRFLPGGSKMAEQEALSFAQFSIAQGLDPFAREIWYIPGIGVVTGIEGYRKMARAQSTFAAHDRLMTAAEREEHGLTNPKDVGVICEIFRHDVLYEAVEINKVAGKEIIPIRPIVGIGVWRQGDNVPKARTPRWVAAKRAEADGLRKAFDLRAHFSDELGGSPAIVSDSTSDDVLEAEYTTEPPPKVEDPSPEPLMELPKVSKLTPQMVAQARGVMIKNGNDHRALGNLESEEFAKVVTFLRESGQIAKRPNQARAVAVLLAYSDEVSARAAGWQGTELPDGLTGSGAPFESGEEAIAALAQSWVVKFDSPPEQVLQWCRHYRGSIDLGDSVHAAVEFADDKLAAASQEIDSETTADKQEDASK